MKAFNILMLFALNYTERREERQENRMR